MKKLLTIFLILLVVSGCTKNYKVTFDYDSNITNNTIEVEKGKTVSEPTAPVKEGYVFDYWTCDGIKYDFTKIVEQDLTLKAQYTKVHTVVFKVDDQVIDTRKVKDNQSCVDEISAPIPEEKEGYIFVGWLNGENTFDLATPVVSDLELVASYEKDDVVVESIKFNKTSLLLARNDNAQLSVTITPTDATNQTISYTSTHPEIATVDNSGKVIAKAKGTTTIIATSSNGKTTVCDVEVFVKVESITLTVDRTTIAYDGVKKANFTATISPSDADITTVSWQTEGNVGGQNGSYSIDCGSNTAVLTARDTSKYDKSCSVYAYIKNKDGSVVKSNKITISAEETLTLTKQAGTNVTWNFENNKYTAYCPNNTNLEIKANVAIEASFNSKDYINQEYYEEKEVWITVSNSHSHTEGFVMTVTTPGGQQRTVTISVGAGN